MNIPSLPTDNLYKFMSLTGVLLVVVSYGAHEYRLHHGNTLATEVTLGKEALKYLERDGERLAERAEELMSMDPEERDEYIANYSKDRNHFLERTRDLDREIMALRRKSEISDLYYESTMRVRPWLLIASGLGGALIYLGFQLWYIRLQKYQDILIRYQAEEAEQKMALRGVKEETDKDTNPE